MFDFNIFYRNIAGLMSLIASDQIRTLFNRVGSKLQMNIKNCNKIRTKRAFNIFYRNIVGPENLTVSDEIGTRRTPTN